MTTKDLEILFDYGYWANAKLRQALQPLSAEEFTRAVTGAYGSVRNTLVHVMSSEWGWLDRCGGAPRGGPLKASDYPTADALFTRWQCVERDARAFLATLTDADLEAPIPWTSGGPTVPSSLPRGQLLHHAANHGVHHRGQVALLLRSLGRAPGNFDILDYYADTAHAR